MNTSQPVTNPFTLCEAQFVKRKPSSTEWNLLIEAKKQKKIFIYWARSE